MNEIVFGSPEHLAGLSRAALEADFRFVNDRRNELEDACEQLEAENVRLRSCLSDTEEHASMFLWENNQLKEENAKLRELVRDYEHCTMYADCAHCKYDGKLSTHCPLSPCFPDTDELRELGVEVDE